MDTQATKLEEAQALGFSSIEECIEHQAWLDQQAEQNERIRLAVKAANDAGSQTIDVRFVSGQQA